MFCYQCQETVKNQGCTIKGVCGKDAPTSDMQDLLIYVMKGMSYAVESGAKSELDKKDIAEIGEYLLKGLFTTITNVSFDEKRVREVIEEGLAIKKRMLLKLPADKIGTMPKMVLWDGKDDFEKKAAEVGILATENEDIRSLRELLIYGLKGIAAYTEHANVLGYYDENLIKFAVKALAATADDSVTVEQLVALVLECGKYGVDAMALLNQANTETYGNPEPTEVNIGVHKNPAILISGHDLLDLYELLEQTKGTGVDVYTHGEMLPANAYPLFKKYGNLVGNYGGSWWKQQEEFANFNGPILMTTNCLMPPLASYKDKVFTTSVVAFPGLKHIAPREKGKQKDFSEIIKMAKQNAAPQEIETGKITIGFGLQTLLDNVDNVIDAVSKGAVSRFVVMAGCDGKHKDREYFTDVAKKLPQDTIILTAGCAKYRYNKLDLGKIGPFSRVLDAGQCNDSYSLAVLALTLKEKLNLEDINQLPISFDLAWYEQKAVLVLLSLLYLGFKNIRVGPTLPAFVSPNVLKVLVENFQIKPTSNPEADIAQMV